MSELAVFSPAKREPHRHNQHGVERVDEYHWLRDRENPDVIEYLEQENRLTERTLEPTKELQDGLYEEMVSRLNENDEGVPVSRRRFEYFWRTFEGKQYRAWYRRPLDGGDEELIFDSNAEAEQSEYFRLGAMSISPDEKLMAFSVDRDGSEKFTICIRSLETGETLPDRIVGVQSSVEWHEDGRSVFYVGLDEMMRPFKVFQHELGGTEDRELLHEPDDRFFLGIGKTRSRRFLMVELGSKMTSEAWVCDLQSSSVEFRCISPRRQGHEYEIDHQGDRFLIRTNDAGENFRVVEAPVDAPEESNWTEVRSHNSELFVDAVSCFADFFLVWEREDGLQHIRVLHKNGSEHRVELPEPVYAINGEWNLSFDAASFRFGFSSLVTPYTVLECDAASRELKTLKQDRVHGYDPTDYVCERLHVETADGVRVPVSVAKRKDATADGPAPTLLYGYGSYGICIDPGFRSTRASLLDRGIVFAIAHIRGGGELGRPWYLNGKFLSKKNTFDDFIAVADHLVTSKVTSSDRLAIHGGSAGGLLMGAVVNERPELFQAVIADVPFVDVINTMLDDTLPLTVTEYEEWGNPNEKEFFDYMLSYSPYDNVAEKDYPHMLVTGGLNDPRVQYWEPAKWVAKMRQLKRGDRVLMLKTNMGAGHGGPSGRYEALRETALRYAFVIEATTAKEPFAQS